jgi:hypothetical protein
VRSSSVRNHSHLSVLENSAEWVAAPVSGEYDPPVRFRVEHYRAVDVPDSALGYEFTPTGRVEELDAHDDEDAAAMALTVAGDDAGTDGVVTFDPGPALWAVPGDEEAVKVTPIED